MATKKVKKENEKEIYSRSQDISAPIRLHEHNHYLSTRCLIANTLPNTFIQTNRGVCETSPGSRCERYIMPSNQSGVVMMSHSPFSLYWRKQSLSNCIVILLAIHVYNTHVVARTDLTLFLESFLREYYTLAWQKTVKSLTRMLFPEKILMGLLVVCLFGDKINVNV